MLYSNIRLRERERERERGERDLVNVTDDYTCMSGLSVNTLL